MSSSTFTNQIQLHGVSAARAQIHNVSSKLLQSIRIFYTISF